MSLVYRGVSANNSGGSISASASNAQVGDLLIIFVGSYAGPYTSVSGGSGTTWNTLMTVNGPLDSGSRKTCVTIFWKFAESADLTATFTLSGGQNSYSGIYLVAVGGADQTTPIGASSNATTLSNVVPTASGNTTTTRNSLRYLFFSQMNSTSATTSWSAAPTGFTKQTTQSGTLGYESVQLYTENATYAPNTFAAFTSTAAYSNVSGVGTMVAVYEAYPAPTVSNFGPNFGVNTSAPMTFTWDYYDTNSFAQSDYEVSYRAYGSSDTYTTVSSAVATHSHSFAAGTFTNGNEYEVRLRVKNGYTWTDYATIKYTAGPSVWQYGVQTTSTSVTNNPLYATYLWDFESTDISAWQSNTAFNAYVASTLARSTTKFDTGVASLEVTVPTTTTTPTWANVAVPVIAGQPYTVSARVWVPTGIDHVGIDNLFAETSFYKSKTHDAWETITATFQGNPNGTSYVGVWTIGTTAGQKFYIDNFKITVPNLDGGTYEIQVKTSNGVWGPWSAIQTFTAKSSPTASNIDVNPKRVGGNINVTWTYNDADSDAQAKYQIRNRPS